jgi:hypothetical protein
VARPVRTIDIATTQDTFLIVAVCTVLTIRLQLWATDYPQLSGGRLHIAHLLYGGLFMVTAIVLAISFVGRRWRVHIAILGGVGFGFFIDEVGKFITKDNDYFFKPAAAIIYLVFLVLFFATQATRRIGRHTPDEAVANAIDVFADAALARGLSGRERHRALALLDHAPDHPLTAPMRSVILHTATLPDPPPSRARRFVLGLRERYYRSVEEAWFRRVLVVVFSLWSLVNLSQVLVLVLSIGLRLGGARHGFQSDSFSQLTVGNVASIVSAGVASGFMVSGLLRLRHDRARAYRQFERALLITVFVTQVFVFVESSFSAATGMVIAVLLLLTVRYMVRQEDRRAALLVDDALTDRTLGIAPAPA